MIIAVDIETRGLDARKFLMACLIKDSGKKKFFYDKSDLWEYIIELGKKEMRRGKVLTVYSHNAQFDFYGYANIKDPNIHYFCLRPFIAEYMINKIPRIYFLDSMGIFKMSLKKMGEIIGIPKMEMTPDLLDENKKWTKKELKEKVAKYVENDTKIVMEGIQMVKRKIKEEDMKIQRLYTTSQIAITYLMNKIAKSEKHKGLLEDVNNRIFPMTKYKKDVHSAYRGGKSDREMGIS